MTNPYQLGESSLQKYRKNTEWITQQIDQFLSLHFYSTRLARYNVPLHVVSIRKFKIHLRISRKKKNKYCVELTLAGHHLPTKASVTPLPQLERGERKKKKKKKKTVSTHELFVKDRERSFPNFCHGQKRLDLGKKKK